MREYQDTKEMMQWRSFSQDRIDKLQRELSDKMEDEVLETYKVDESKKDG